MDSEIHFIKTQEGIIPVPGKQVEEFLFIAPKGKNWTVSHRLSGYAIAHFETEAIATAIAEILDTTCDWGWTHPNQMPVSTKNKVHKLFASLSKIVKFVTKMRIKMLNQEAKGRELARARAQKQEALEALESVAIAFGVLIPPGYTTKGVEISKDEFLRSVKRMLKGEKLLPISVVDDEKFADLSVFWYEEVVGHERLHYQESNCRGFVVKYQEIEEAVNKRSASVKFIKSQLLSSFSKDVSDLIIKSKNAQD